MTKKKQTMRNCCYQYNRKGQQNITGRPPHFLDFSPPMHTVCSNTDKVRPAAFLPHRIENRKKKGREKAKRKTINKIEEEKNYKMHKKKLFLFNQKANAVY